MNVTRSASELPRFRGRQIGRPHRVCIHVQLIALQQPEQDLRDNASAYRTKSFAAADLCLPEDVVPRGARPLKARRIVSNHALHAVGVVTHRQVDASSADNPPIAASVSQMLGGETLSGPVQAEFDQRFGVDFSGVLEIADIADLDEEGPIDREPARQRTEPT